MTFTSVLTGTRNNTWHISSALSGLEAYFRADNVTVDASNNVLTMTDLTGNGYDLAYFGGYFTYNSSSLYFQTPTISSPVSGGRLESTGKAPDAGPGEKLNVYVVGRVNSDAADAEASVRQITQADSGASGWTMKVQKHALGDEMHEYVWDSTPAAQTAATTGTAWAPGQAQILRYEIDGDAAHHTMRSAKGAADADWATTGHTTNFSGSLFVGHQTAGVGANMEIAGILYFKNTGITEVQHNRIIEWCEREFITPFDPTIHVPTLEAYWRADAAIISGTNVLTLPDQTANGHDFSVNGSLYWQYKSSSTGFKTATISNASGSIANMRTAISDIINPVSSGRTVYYFANKYNLPAGESNGQIRVMLQQATTGPSSGYYLRTQYNLAAVGARPITYQAKADGTGFTLDIPSTFASDGEIGIWRYQIDDTGNEVLTVINNFDNTPASSTGYSPFSSDRINLGNPAGTVTPICEIAGILCFNVVDRIPWGTHKKIVAWMEKEFFT